MKLKICSGQKRRFGQDITNSGPFIPLISEPTSSSTPVIEPFKHPSDQNENQEPPVKKPRQKSYFSVEKTRALVALKGIRIVLKYF